MTQKLEPEKKRSGRITIILKPIDRDRFHRLREQQPMILSASTLGLSIIKAWMDAQDHQDWPRRLSQQKSITMDPDEVQKEINSTNQKTARARKKVREAK